MSDSAFGIMVLAMSLDFFHPPLKKLKRFETIYSKIKNCPSALKSPFTGLNVVDYACGPGRYSIPLARMVGPAGKVYAVDTQPLAIKIVKREAEQNDLTNIEAVLVDSFDTGIPDMVADIIFLIDAIFPIKNRASLLKEIHRLLKPDGHLLMDPSHMSVRKAQAVVDETGLFKSIITEGQEMVFGKK